MILRPAESILCVAILALAPTARADGPRDTAGIEFFENKVRPVLAENCFRCHGPEKQEGHLRLDSVDGIRKGGDRGPAIAAGKPEESRLIQAIRYTAADLQMPP